MKVIILSATTGGGHMSAANAIKNYLSDFAYEVLVLDTIEYINPILNKTITEGYEYLAKKRPNIYKVMYETANREKIMKAITKVNSLISKKLAPLIDEYNPDVIITTHPFSTEMVSRLKGSGKINIPIVCIMTDYAPHRTWINSSVDAYVVANDDMIQSMYDMGVPYWKVYPYGIPISEGFYAKKDKAIVLKEMGLNPGIPTILIMAGSFGVKNILEIYKEIIEIPLSFQIIVITGRNEQLYDSIEKVINGEKSKESSFEIFRKFICAVTSKILKTHDSVRNEKNRKISGSIKEIKDVHKANTRVIYFTKEVNKYMQTADLIITKPGGLTVTEALACNLPMAIFDAIPGQEDENANFLINKNMAIRLEKGERGAKSIKELLECASKLESMKSSCKTFDKSDSLKKIKLLLERICQTSNTVC